MGGWLDRPNVRVRGVVFDLDGTLVDSYAAIAASLNAARESFGLEPLPEVDGRPVAVISETGCKCCGGCVPMCPENAIDLRGYTDAQVTAMIDSLLEVAVA